MTKFKAFAIHFFISLSVFSVLLLMTFFVWYPQYFANASGVWPALGTAAFVDVGLGPLMTFVLYKKGKPGLLFDLTIVAVLQILALVWGVWMLYTERPVLVAYHDSLMVCLNTQQAHNAGVGDRQRFALPDALVPQAILPPARTAAEIQAREARIQALPAGSPALPVYLFGHQFQPMNAATLPEMLQGELDITPVLKQKPDYQQLWDKFLVKHPEAQEQFAFFTLACGGEDHFAAVNKTTGVIQDALALPFLNARRKHPPSYP